MNNSAVLTAVVSKTAVSSNLRFLKYRNGPLPVDQLEHSAHMTMIYLVELSGTGTLIVQIQLKRLVTRPWRPIKDAAVISASMWRPVNMADELSIALDTVSTASNKK